MAAGKGAVLCALAAGLLVSACGAYGGVYLTGGVIDEMTAEGKTDPRAFARYFYRPMVPVVVESLTATPVYLCKEANMPIRGLAALAGV